MLYRITSSADWKQAQLQGFFTSPDLLVAGYIHSSVLSQVVDTANMFWLGREDVLILEIDGAYLRAEGIEVEVRQQWAAERGQVLNSILGSIPLAAIV
ncbi:DUF952 domain-containing protein [Hymenobacter sp. GOD-10R]|uniref:DUF952 domain-containing protein n=1 Tax=Hymenobacter sp. GOD-10R TaxID=3093922 RepID=UPI002D788B91|nr:DUF952 domain-containing protein [Hymenobacter sp. GOD-10R]WRQ30225.1 DUF952 domain-containing protein [Hymenobacter sp. GOD-10R]